MCPAMRGRAAAAATATAVESNNKEKRLYVSGIQTLELTHKNAHYLDT